MRKYFLAATIFCWAQVLGQNETVDSLKEKLDNETADTAKVDVLHSLCRYYVWSFADTSAIYAQEELQLSRKLNFIIGEAQSMGDLSLAYTVLGNYTGALEYGYKSLALFTNLNDASGIQSTSVVLAFCYREQGDYKQAIQYIKNNLRLGDLTRDETDPAFLILSTIYERNNQLDSALFYAQSVFARRKDWSGVLEVLGDIHAKLGHEELALDFYRKTISTAIQANFLIDIIDAYSGIARIYLTEGKADSAVYYAKLALIQRGGKAYPIGMMRVSTLLADIYESKKITDSTLKYLRLTINLKDSLFNQQKTRAAQGFAFIAQLHQQELASQQRENIAKLKMYFLYGIAILILIIAFFLYRNNRHKQKAFALLQVQKQLIDAQKNKAEGALEELKNTQTQLIQSEKMASLGELTAGIAHEIQNPLNFMNNFSELNTELIEEMKVEIKTGNNSEAIRIADNIAENERKINHHGKRADSIVKGMLQHSREATGQKEPTDINVLADEYLRLSYQGYRAKDKSFNATLQTNFDPTIGSINIIPQDIGRVFLNLYNNAFFTLSEKKKRQPHGYEPNISVRTTMADGKIEIRVRDNGNGIPEKVREKIFQPFFTTKPTGQGTGLGLSLSYDIVKAHRGKINVETLEGEFAEFVIQIPITLSV